MIYIKFDGPVAHIRLERKEARNALDTEGWVELRRAVESVSATTSRVILIESAIEGTFCSGSDIKAIEAIHKHPEEVERFRREMRDAIEAIANLAIPTVANIQGDCFGAGVAIILACDLRIANVRARFGVTPAKLGLSYPLEDIVRLVRQIGAGQTNRLLLTAETIAAPVALEIGLIEMTGERDDVQRVVKTIAANAPTSVATMKRLVGAANRSETLGAEDLFNRFFASDALKEGLQAFREKRHPNFVDFSID